MAKPMTTRVAKVAPLLFGSGVCALIYQVAWLREMRLVFGASTAASAAVLAIFMGGLGLGGAVLGRRVDRHPQPLRFYAHLELTIAATAAITPGLVWLARQVYVGLGGSVALGLGGATAARLVLATLVLCVPTVLMGGTLPAAAKAVETDADVSRRHLALLYGANTLGAVAGTLCSTFFMLEVYGTRTTLWLACLLNAVVGITARSFGTAEARATASTAEAPALADGRAVPLPPAWFVLTAAAVVGFAFLLMELVWYRMLGPLLGGSSFTFGLILAVALLGIGIGGGCYALFGTNRPATMRGFALTCTLEAACIAFPYALGDRVAFLAIFLRPLGSLGFFGLVLGWSGVAALVILPAAIVAGIQFPLLIALLGHGGERIGRHVGLAYAWNTVGAIAGSLAGGFGLLPVLSATGTWCTVVGLLVALGVVSMALSLQTERRAVALWLPAATSAAAVLLLLTTGPTAAWRHSPIGAGRVKLINSTPNRLRNWANARRRAIVWSTDGVESSVALEAEDGLAFLVNGKADGNARFDAPTQVMGGLVGAILQPHPTRALVIGLGTGSTAGWLAAVPSIERVDVVELEPAIVKVAKACTPVNHGALANPKVHIFIGDAREVLLTTPQRYDIIFSEPSNPYRAGIASLFTQEFYRAVATRLAANGIFLQWLQAYEVDSQTIRTAYATLESVFPSVETWRTMSNDLLLVASRQPLTYDVPALRARIRQEPFKTALAAAWRATSLEELLAHYLARPSLAHEIADVEGNFLNTDDHTPVEFAFARGVGHQELFHTAELERAARARGEDRPEVIGGEVDWGWVEDARLTLFTSEPSAPPVEPDFPPARRRRAEAQAEYVRGNFPAVLSAWRAQPRRPRGPVELVVIATALANAGDEGAVPLIEQLRALQPAEADAILGELRAQQARPAKAAAALEAAFKHCQTDPWALPSVIARAIKTAVQISKEDPALAGRLYDVLRMPFAAAVLNDERLQAALTIGAALDFRRLCVQGLAPLEPYVPWNRHFLAARARCYRETGDARAAQAQDDLNAFLRNAPVAFSHGLSVPTPRATPEKSDHGPGATARRRSTN